MRRVGWAAIAGLAAAVLLVTLGQVHLLAATFVVNDPSDRVDASPGNGVCRTSAGTCTLRAAIQEANARSGADIIQVPAGTYAITRAPQNDNAADTGDLDIVFPLTITGDGAGLTIIDGGAPPFSAPPEQTALDRVFEIHPTAGNVTISNLTVREGWDEKEGGAIYNWSRGTVRLIGVEVRDSFATGYGGGIYHDGYEGGSLVIERSTIRGNSTAGYGGGLYSASGLVTITGTAQAPTVVTANSAASGGGVYNEGKLNGAGQSGRVAVSQATFTGNIATANGGAIANELEGELVLVDVNVSGNTAAGYGGGVSSVSKTTLSIVRGNFSRNLAGGPGGAVYTQAERNVTIQDLMCTENGAGGVLPVDDPTRDTGPIGAFEPADEGGGCLSLDGKGTTSVSGSTIVGNAAVGEGGGIAIQAEGAVTITDTAINENHSGLNGGGVMNAGMRVTFTRVTVKQNDATEAGGGIENQGSGVFSLLDSSILSNSAGIDGGGFHNEADSVMRIAGSTFWDNRAANIGGGFYHRSDAVTEIENSTLSGNIAQVNGGGLFVDADGGLRLVNVTITRNSAPRGSGVGTPDDQAYVNVPVVPSSAATFRNSIVAGNLLSQDCWGAFVSEGGNQDGGTNCYFQGPRDRSNVFPGLLAIADNNGPTLTHALTSASLGVDGGVNPCPPVDQRGVTRPKNAACDVGAYEFEGAPSDPDGVPPNTIIISAPSASDGAATFVFTGTDNMTLPEQLGFECRIVNQDPTEPPEPVDPTEPPPDPTVFDPTLNWVSCSSPWVLDPSGLTPGALTFTVPEGHNEFRVRAIDRAGNIDPTPAVHTWIDAADEVPPDTTLVSTPVPTTTSNSATFSFSGTDNLTPVSLIEYECRLDFQDWSALGECANPMVFSNLSTGTHTFEVRALDLGDNFDPSPASFTWTILPPTTCEQANITLSADADTWIDEFNPSTNYGIDLNLQVRSQELAENARALVRFALPAELPPCALATATLRLYANSGTADRLLQALPIAAPWQEMGATWINQPPTVSVGPRDIEEPSGSGGGFQEWDVTGPVAAMLGGGMENHGFLIRDAAEGSAGAETQTFSSKDTIADVSQTPQLVLRFAPTDPNAPPPTPPTPAVTPTTVVCAQVLTESTLVGNDLVNCPGEGLIIGASNIYVDLGGHTIDGLNYMLTGQEEGIPGGIRNSGFTNVVITNGVVQEFGNGVHLTAGTTYTVVEHLTLVANALAGVGLADADNGLFGNEIRDNVLIGNNDGVAILTGSENSRVFRNRFIGNIGVGVRLIDASGHQIQSNDVSGYSLDPTLGSDGGVWLQGSSDNVVVGNTVRGTGDAGIYLTGGSHRNVIDGNVLSQAGDTGVFIENSNTNQVTNNIAHLGSDSGVSLSGANDNVVRGNDLRFNPTGVSISAARRNVIDANDASEALGTGIGLEGGALDNQVLNNVANLTGGDGISLEGAAFDANGNPLPPNRLAGNTANQNRGDGIAVLGEGHRLADNAAHNNAAWGISAEGAVDEGGNAASGNGMAEQCLGVVCDTSGVVALMPPDTTPPDTVITLAPANGASSATPQIFEFTGSDNHAPLTALRFECRLDPAPDPPPPPQDPNEPFSPPSTEGWVSCVSPVIYPVLTTGEHTFQVRAVDPASNFDSEYASYTWTVSAALPGEADSTPPETEITQTPANPSTDPTATFVFRGVDDSTPGFDLRFECSLDGGSFAACASPSSYTLATGAHTFSVRAIDLAGNVDPSPAAYSWTINVPPPDTTAPETAITAGPDALTVNTSATFMFSASEPATFQCSLDGASFTPCTSPQVYNGLAPGDRTFRVRAMDGAGNVDATPAEYAWIIGSAPEPMEVTCGQVLVTSAIVMNDLVDCPDVGLVIGASAITVDLNGFTIDGIGPGTGILNNGFDLVTITNGTVQEFDYGVQLNAGSARNIVSALRVQNNDVAGIQLSDADEGGLGNTLRENTLVSNGTGIALIDGTGQTLVRANIVGASSLEGIRVAGSSGNRIEENEVNGSALAGIALDGSSNNTIVGNKLALNSGDAISMLAASNANRVENNTIQGGAGGVLASGSDGSQLVGNLVSEVSSAGIALDAANNSIVQGNFLRFNAGGISLFASSGNRLESNDASESSGAGISLGGVSLQNVVIRNTANHNEGEGISVEDPAPAEAGNVIEGNTANANTSDGIHVTAGTHTITANTANHNTGWGIYAEVGNIDGGANSATGNEILEQCFGVACSGTPLADLQAPDTLIVEGPANPSTAGSASFTFTGSDNLTALADLTFQCRLDSQNAADFVACTSPQVYAGLAGGTHMFEVRAVDQAGNVDPQPAAFSWTITPPGIAPETSIDSGPDPVTASADAVFTFSSNEPGATFACSLDGGAFTACTSPSGYSGLAAGDHDFAVRATDLEGLTDETPATHAWTVGAPAVPTQVSCGQVLTQSTLVLNDLTDCTGDGLVVGADRITIDLNGHLIDGVGVGAGIRNDGFDWVTIMDGTISAGTRDEVPVPETVTSGVTQFDTGVALGAGAAENIVSSLNVWDHDFTGIELSNAVSATVRSTWVFGNSTGIALIGGTQHSVVRNNVVDTSAEFGILVAGSIGNRIEANRVSGSGNGAIVLDAANLNEVVQNTVSANPSEAISLLNGSTGNRIDRNTLTENAGGIYLFGANANQVTGNRVSQTADAGISLEDANDNLLRGNDVRFNEGGITLLTSSGNQIESNNASSSTGNGISLESDSIRNTLLLNSVNANSGDGIAVMNAAPAGQGNLIDRNTTSGNLGDGIQVTASAHTIVANTADNNGGWGMFAELGNVDGGGNFATGNAEPEQCFNIVCTSTSTAGQPETAIVEFPPALSNSQFATFTFTGVDDTAAAAELSFQCRLDSQDPAAWVDCDNPWIYSNLSAGAHTFEVRAIDPTGQIDATPAAYSWTYEPLPSGVAPDTIITSGPGLQTMLFDALFLFTANEPDVTFECSLDGAPFTACGFVDPVVPTAAGAMEYTFEEFQVGPHQFRVRAIDLEGNVDPTPAVHNWTIVGVLTTIVNGPAFEPSGDPNEPASGGETDSTVATFAFVANVADSTFQCSIDMQPFTACTSPITYADLAVGEHLFLITATDPEGVTQVEPLEYSWTVVAALDTTPPDTIITLAPAIGSSDMVFEFTGTDNVTPPVRLTFECRLDSTLEADFFSCVSPLNLLAEFPDLAPGQHTFDVRAIDEGSGGTGTQTAVENIDPTPASHTWTSGSDTTPPETAFVSGPAALTLEPDVVFEFAGTDNATPLEGLTFECALDGAAFEPCDSPHSVQGVEPGAHTLQVRTVDLALNADQTPASYSWTLEAAPEVTLLSFPAMTTTDTTAAFTFTANEPGAAFACSLDGGAFATCASPVEYAGLSAGPHAFSLRATDAGGNVSEPVSYEWTVEGPDTTAPETTITASPPTTTTALTASFAFAASEPNTTFECSLNGEAFAGCVSPHEITVPGGGSYTLAVRAVDLAGNVDATPASDTWEVQAAPETTILTGPAAEATETSATFTFSASEPGATFECSLDLGAFAPCASPVTYHGLAAGDHELQVRAISTLGLVDLTPDDYEWTILSLAPDTTAPQTMLTAGPEPITTDTEATFSFTADEAGSTFECSLDGAAFAPCSGSISYTGLSVDLHTFAVRATDAAGNTDPTPAEYTWSVDAQ